MNRPLHDHRRRRHAMNTPQNPTLEAAEAGECPEGQISPSGLSAPQTADGNAAVEAAVTAGAHDADASDGAEPDRPATQQAAPSHPPGNRRANAASTAQVDVMPRWLRRQIEQAYVPLPNAHFVPRILREVGWAVTPPITPSQAPPASVTPTVPAAPIAGSICPTCNCRVPARLNAAERQRAYRERQREKLVAATTLHPTGL
jgi:hypothetical protein